MEDLQPIPPGREDKPVKCLEDGTSYASKKINKRHWEGQMGEKSGEYEVKGWERCDADRGRR